MPNFTASPSVDRRQLLKSAAFAAALGASGGGVAKAEVATKPTVRPNSFRTNPC